eukprot:COSAG03_NODE_2852_length_2407_cov_2.578856_1_plen_87_part_00
MRVCVCVCVCVFVCVCCIYIPPGQVEQVNTRLGEAMIASGRELLAAADLEREAASQAKASPLGAEAEVRLSTSLGDLLAAAIRCSL